MDYFKEVDFEKRFSFKACFSKWIETKPLSKYFMIVHMKREWCLNKFLSSFPQSGLMYKFDPLPPSVVLPSWIWKRMIPILGITPVIFQITISQRGDFKRSDLAVQRTGQRTYWRGSNQDSIGLLPREIHFALIGRVAQFLASPVDHLTFHNYRWIIT